MTLDLLFILVLGGAAFLYAALLPGRGRSWALLAGSVIAIYWLQPSLPIRFSSFILQTTTVVLTVGTWALTRPISDFGFRVSDLDPRSQIRNPRSENLITLVIVIALVILIAFNRYLNFDVRVTADRPPPPLLVASVLGVLGFILLALLRRQKKAASKRTLGLAILIIVVLLVILKWEPLAVRVSAVWRSAAGQDAALAGIGDLAWLGFSYVAFRLIHTLRDRQTGILPDLTLREYVIYVLFTPAYIAGPIDRAERFLGDLQSVPQMVGLDGARFTAGGTRILIGMFKKFVIADGLAQGMSLTPLNAAQATSTPGLWLLLYGYAFRLFFDFAGYTDIAIGLGMFFGINLPENFNRPYLSTTITNFWQRWHITLSDWVRFYVFTPLSRSLLRRKPRPSPTLIVLVSQLATMIVIGLWHGITLNFFIWGVWHGLALFAHKQWSDRTRKWYRGLKDRPWQKRAWTFFSWFLTFQYVVLGWVWFLMPTPRLALDTFARLFGVGG
ncbi:MAG: MBOAT family O-acyltransferase [Candidatus Promineifilaceae bacterium]